MRFGSHIALAIHWLNLVVGDTTITNIVQIVKAKPVAEFATGIFAGFNLVQHPTQVPIPYTGGWKMQRRTVCRFWGLWAFYSPIPKEVVIYSDGDIF